MATSDITVTRSIPARAEEVFDLWLNAKSPGGPWHGAERLIQNPVVDGLYYLAVKHAGRVWPHYGRFLRIERPRLIEYTWMSEGTKGLESVVSFALEHKGENTEVTLRHTGLPDEALGRQHEEGWTAILGQLATDLIARKK